MNRLLREERGGILVLSAFLIPIVFLVMFALIVDTGTWFTHKRQLQNRADAGALAAGVEYARVWAACGDPLTKARNCGRDRHRRPPIRGRPRPGDPLQHRGHGRRIQPERIEDQR